MNLNLECIQADSAIEKQKHRTVRNLWTIVGIAAALVVSACGGKKSVSPEDYPVAVAAADSSVVTLGKQVTLIGRGSYDPKGKQLLFHWSQGTTNPSPVVFSANDSQNASAVQVTLDQAGTYAFALVVESEKGLKSLPDTVVVTAKKWELNTAEHKQTGSYFKISNKEQGEETEDRAPVTIQWRFISYIVARGAVQISGEYTLTWQNPNSRSLRITTSQLEFVDTLETKIAKHDISPKDDFVLAAGATKTRTGTFTTSLSAPEISDQVSRMNVWGSVEYTAGVLANAGPDQTVTTEETVRLDGSGSRDEGGQPLNYWWSGDISLDDEYMARPSFIANTAGTFRFWLVVNSGFGPSAPDTVVVKVNYGVVADAGADRTVTIGETVQLDGSSSRSSRGGFLTYQWTGPNGIVLIDAAAEGPSFTANTAGNFKFALVVDDGVGHSLPDTVVVTVKDEVILQSGKSLTATLPKGVTMDFLWLEPGTFLMGSPDNDPYAESEFYEKPQHRVTLTKEFYLGKYEVTQTQWRAVMGAGPWPDFAANPNYPAISLDEDLINEFIHKLNVAVGDSLYRLPTEAEWEYACRAGTTTPWSFGDDASILGRYAYWDDGGVLEVGSLLPNPWGFFDMHGNAWELVQDYFEPYSPDAQTNPVGRYSNESVFNFNIYRGGHWAGIYTGAAPGVIETRSAYRYGGLYASRGLLGVRLVRIK